MFLSFEHNHRPTGVVKYIHSFNTFFAFIFHHSNKYSFIYITKYFHKTLLCVEIEWKLISNRKEKAHLHSCSVILDSSLHLKKVPLKSWTPIMANMNWSMNVTNMILPIVFTATITHCTTCFNENYLPVMFEMIVIFEENAQ